MYHKYVKTLELGWTNPQQPTKWIPYKFQELTKRTVRYILMLTNTTSFELQNIKILAWFEMHRYKKIMYHLCRFLRYLYLFICLLDVIIIVCRYIRIPIHSTLYYTMFTEQK